MTKNALETVVGGTTWTELTDDDVTVISFQVRGDDYVLVEATTGTAPSAGSIVGYHYNAQMGAQSLALAELWPGVTGADRVFARTETGNSVVVMVSHA